MAALLLHHLLRSFPIEATLIFATARVLDAVISPLMGFLTDNFGSTWLGKRFGRRKFFILLGIPCVFSYSIMWVGDMGFWYYLLTYLLFDIVYTMILVPYETLVPEMTDDFKQKTKFSGARISMAQMSAILASFLPGVLLTIFGKDNAVSFFLCQPGVLGAVRHDVDLRLVLYLGTPA